MVYIEQVYASSARTCDYYDGRIMPIISITELTELLNYFLAARFIPQVVRWNRSRIIPCEETTVYIEFSDNVGAFLA